MTSFARELLGVAVDTTVSTKTSRRTSITDDAPVMTTSVPSVESVSVVISLLQQAFRAEVGERSIDGIDGREVGKALSEVDAAGGFVE